MPQLEYATPVWKSQIQTLEQIQRSYTKFMFGYESPLTYPDRLDRLNMLPLSYRRDISDLCQLCKFIQDPCSLPPDSLHFRNDPRCTRQSESANFSIPRCKNEQSRKFYFNRVVVYSWNKLSGSVKNASTLLDFKKSLTTYFNDILESDFNLKDTCTWVHVCKLHYVDNARNVKTNRGGITRHIYCLPHFLACKIIIHTYVYTCMHFYTILINFILYVYFIVHIVTVFFHIVSDS